VKTPVSIAAIVLAVTAIVGSSVWSAVREQRRLLDEFAVATQRQAHASVELLSARLDALDQDTRLLINLVERSRRNTDLDLATERRTWTTAFQALATVVPQYRAIGLFEADGTLDVLAVDPTETRPTIEALAAPSRLLAIEVSARKAQALARSAARYEDRAFVLYGTPVGAGGGAVVVASDVALFLGGMAWSPVPSARLIVRDPAGTAWAGCETSRGCRAAAAEVADLAPTAAIRISERVARPTGAWTVTWVASSQAIVERERWRLARLVSATMATAIAVAGVGLVILRQQRKAVGLETALGYAQALASARATSEAIVESAPLGVLGVSEAGRVVLANRFLSERLGEIRIGARLEEAFSGPGVAFMAELGPALTAAVRGEGAHGDATGSTGSTETRALTTTSQRFHVRVVPVRHPALGVRAFALVEDQSELRKLEDHLVRAEKLITVGVLSAGIAHEIGSPLAIIRGRAEQVLRHVSDPARAEDLRVIMKHIDSISTTIRQVLDFSRRQPIVRQAVALAGAVAHAQGLLAFKLDAKEHDLELGLPADLPPLAADPDQLQQVLVNLLRNASDASAPGQRITLSARQLSAGLVRIDIVDRGCGIGAEHLHAVFDPFFTTKKPGEGTGLGLPITASIVRNHAGEINLVSAPERGTTVSLVWPVFAPATATPTAATGASGIVQGSIPATPSDDGPRPSKVGAHA
jgi:signal transduction histidine kinase